MLKSSSSSNSVARALPIGAFISAAEEGAVQEVQEMLNKANAADKLRLIYSANEHGWCAIGLAIYGGHTAVAQAFLSIFGANQTTEKLKFLNGLVMGKTGSSLLNFAVGSGKTDIASTWVAALLACKADINLILADVLVPELFSLDRSLSVSDRLLIMKIISSSIRTVENAVNEFDSNLSISKENEVKIEAFRETMKNYQLSNASYGGLVRDMMRLYLYPLPSKEALDEARAELHARAVTVEEGGVKKTKKIDISSIIQDGFVRLLCQHVGHPPVVKQVFASKSDPKAIIFQKYCIDGAEKFIKICPEYYRDQLNMDLADYCRMEGLHKEALRFILKVSSEEFISKEDEKRVLDCFSPAPILVRKISEEKSGKERKSEESEESEALKIEPLSVETLQNLTSSRKSQLK